MAVILIVEDEDQVRVLAEGILQDSGYTTLSASNFDQALALVEGPERIDLIFTDIGLQSDIQAGLMLAQEPSNEKSIRQSFTQPAKGSPTGCRLCSSNGLDFWQSHTPPSNLS